MKLRKTLTSILFSLFIVNVLFAQILYVHKADGLPLRSEPNFNATIIKKLPNGQSVYVLDTINDWFYVSVYGTKGYVYSYYLKRIEPVYKSQPNNYIQPQTHHYVYICNSPNAYAYHKNLYCRGLQRCRHQILKISKQEAINRGYRPCKICY